MSHCLNKDGLSILIPLYNQVGVALATALSKQVVQCAKEEEAKRNNKNDNEDAQSSLGFEIIFADDGSADIAAKQCNAAIAQLPYCQYIERPQNAGRSAIRNYLAQVAHYKHLLFLDGDVVIDRPNFVQTYLAHRTDADVIIGTLHFSREKTACETTEETMEQTKITKEEQQKAKSGVKDAKNEAKGAKNEVKKTTEPMLYDDNLKYRYEQQFLAQHPVKKRMQQPYASFRTTNFMVRRDLLLTYPFDETFHEYGYEDTLFGKQLKEHGATLIHLDNAATIADYEDNATFVAKTEESLRTLAAHAHQLQGYSTLLHTANKLKCLHLQPLIAFVFKLFKGLLHKNLCSNSPSVFLFNVYKLGYYINLTCSINQTH